MFRKILVGYQDSERGRGALRLARILAEATDAGVTIATAPRAAGEELARFAAADHTDLVVLGPTHRGALGRVFPGTTLERFLAKAPCAVAVAPPGFGAADDGDSGWRPLGGGDAGLRVIGVGFDGSPSSHEALRLAGELAIANGAALRVYAIAAVEAGTPVGPSRLAGVLSPAAALQGELHEAVALLPSEARALPVFLRGAPPVELLKAVESGVDLLILGGVAEGPLRRTWRGSVSRTVLEQARCPVLISPSTVREPRPALAG